MNRKTVLYTAIIIFATGIISFQLSGSRGKSTTPGFQVSTDKGIGPFKDVKLAAVDPVKVKKGMAVFMQKCFICHDLDNKKLAPPLRNITREVPPEFILNMIVNPTEMQKQNPRAQAQMKKYNNLPMLDQQLSQPDALNILDYLRSVAKK